MRVSTENKLSLSELRKIEPSFESMSDDQLMKLRDSLYEIGALALENYLKDKIEK